LLHVTSCNKSGVTFEVLSAGATEPATDEREQMSTLVVVGYIVLGIGVLLFILTVVKKLVDHESRIKIIDKIEISLPGTLVLAVLGGLLAVIGNFGPTFTSTSSQPGNDGRPPVSSTTAAPSDEPTAATSTGTAEPKLTVLEPRPNAIISEDGFPVSGRSNLAVTDTLWVVYRGITNSNPSFQPHSEPCSIVGDGSFTCPLEFVGGSEDSGNRFELFFLLADATAVQAFLDYEASNPAAQNYPGLDVLPPGVRQVGSVIVQRQ